MSYSTTVACDVCGTTVTLKAATERGWVFDLRVPWPDDGTLRVRCFDLCLGCSDELRDFLGPTVEHG